jgi:hypothetical protein
MAQESNNCGNTIVLANDSDFLFFQGCKYVTFDAGIECSANMTPVARILTRQGLSNHFDTNERTLVEWAVYLGNDFTGPLVRSTKTKGRQAHQDQLFKVMDASLQECKEDTSMLPDRHEFQQDPEGMLDELDTVLGETKRLHSDHHGLQTAIDFSRAYYNHGDMDVFDDDTNEHGTKNHGNDNNDNDGGGGETTKDPITFATYIDRMDVRNGNFAKDMTSEFGPTMLMAMAQTKTNHHHQTAIERVLNGERYYYNEAGERFHDNGHCGHEKEDGRMLDVQLEWGDVQFAYQYQKCCKSLASRIKGYAEEEVHSEQGLIYNILLSNVKNAPASLFHGPTFHLLMRECRQKEQEEGETRQQQQEQQQQQQQWETDVREQLNTANEAEDGGGGDNGTGGDNDDDDTEDRHNTLPIDDHRARILKHIEHHRVTIIQGETGCGKSSRVPALLLEGARQPHRIKMFVSQPRRIAATTLKRRVAETLGERVGLRLGNGVRDESKHTQIWYCTAGYLSR